MNIISSLVSRFRGAASPQASGTKFAVVVLSPQGYVHSAAFSEVAETLHSGMRALGIDCELIYGAPPAGRRPIILGSNLLPAFSCEIPQDSILYNLEQAFQGKDTWTTPALLQILKNYTVWDYSGLNASNLKKLGVPVAAVVPVGYAPELTRIDLSGPKDIDVLFFGSMNDRRRKVLKSMQDRGLNVVALFGVYGRDRDAYIARARLVVNLHFYDAMVLETVRISYLLANGIPVLSEASSSPEEDRAFSDGVAFSSYEDLAETAARLVGDPLKLQELSTGGLALMRSRPVTHFLQPALAALSA